MRKVALRGLFARKLRLALTVLAVVLGTTLIAGTYVFTDSINSAFDTIFTVSNRGTDAAITPHKTIDTTNNGGTAPTVPGPVLDKVRRQPGVANAEGSIFDAGTILGKDGKRIGSRRGAELPRLGRRRAALPGLHAQDGPQAAERRRGGDRRRDGRQGGVEGRRQGLRRRHRAAQVLHARRDDPDRRPELVRRRRGARPRAARGPADARQGRRLRRDPGRRQARRLAAAAQDAAGAHARPDGRRAHRPGAGGQGVQGHPRQPRVPEDLPARVRLHRAVRGRLPDLQHLLDHRRPAHARVRAAAHPRRVAPPDLAGGRQRGAHAGLRRRRRRLPAGHRDGGAPARAVQGVRRRPAEQGRRHRDAAR